MAATSLKSILRSIIELESQGGYELFGKPSFDVHDLLQVNSQGIGVASILRLMNLQDKPKLFSTFMLGLLNSVYSAFSEISDSDKPKLVIFILHNKRKNFYKQPSLILVLIDTLRSMMRLIFRFFFLHKFWS
ncbi:helicase HerA-like domain-containing protein [Legionella oakridgensis]|uniref:helicase HerA-like domain-containing protein n=1 Tax=Legionella oakridgensis TaxID=29423 RepID=UPI001ED9B271